MRIYFLGTALLALSCATSSITFLDAEGDPITLEQQLGGRGCIAVNTDKSGGIDVIMQQDASSDWAGVRVIPTLAQAVITAFFGSRDPDGADYSGPSSIQGCAGLFSESLEEDDGHTHGTTAPNE